GELADALRRAMTARRRAAAALGLAVAVAIGVGAWLRPRADVAEAWPDVTEVRTTLERLARRDECVLIGGGAQPAYDLPMGPGSGKALERTDELFTVSSGGLPVCLVELLPGLPPGRYRVEAELRHDVGDGHSAVGIYVAGSRYRTNRARQNLFARVAYADRGTQALAPAGGPNDGRPPCGFVSLAPQYAGDTPDRLNDGVTVFDATREARFASALNLGTAPGWRVISLLVDAEGISAWWGGAPLGRLPVTGLTDLRRDLGRTHFNLPERELPVRMHGAMGVYVNRGVVSVRRFAVRRVAADGD
ncbi:MAG TPA: hypothetical protein VGF55_22990, partial [Gemmataceae bacterium]